MQIECFQSQATPDGPIRMGPIAESKNYTRCSSRIFGCKCDVPCLPPCVPQPGIPAQPPRSAPCQLDERWKCQHKKAFLYLNRATVVQRGAYLSAHPEQLRKEWYASTCACCRGLTHRVPSPRPFERNYSSGIAGWRIRFTRTTCRWVEHAKNKIHVQRQKRVDVRTSGFTPHV